MNEQRLVVLGIMSGSSMDGLDLAVSAFQPLPGKKPAQQLDWEYLEGRTIPLAEGWAERLSALPRASAQALAQADAEFGAWIGQHAQTFLQHTGWSIDAIASHGHTVCHDPQRGLSLQIGSGAAIAAQTGLTTIDNFRMQDVQLGGQGAPLAPVADRLLFPEYDFLLNLGGIANLSAYTPRGYVAFDCTGANQVLNALARQLGVPYDDGGAIAAQGRLLPELLTKALALPYHQAGYPKSLGNDWVQEQLLPLYLSADGDTKDKLHTACWQIGRSIAAGVAAVLDKEALPAQPFRMMASGGGALNAFLLDCIQAECEKLCSLAVELPSRAVIDYKEAVLMALMGALRLWGQPNVLPSVTGAQRAACAGAVHHGAIR